VNETYISFYLKSNRIHLFVDSLRNMGSPSRICFMIEESGETLLVAPYEKRDFKSHYVPPVVYNGTGGMEVNSFKLCRMIANLHHWDVSRSYRIPGKVYSEQKVAIFSLSEAEAIETSHLLAQDSVNN